MKNQAVAQAIETIRNRIDQLGVSEPIIQEHGLGQYQILVQLPGIDDPARVKEIMQSTAMLEIKQSLGGPTRANRRLCRPKRRAASRRDSAAGQSMAPRDDEAADLVLHFACLSCNWPRSAKRRTQHGMRTANHAVHFNLTGEGGQRFYNFTQATSVTVWQWFSTTRFRKSQIIKSRFATRVRSAVGSPIRRRKIFPWCFVRRTACQHQYLEERTVGPSLGADSIRAGVRAAVIGMVAVLIFMLIYYRGAGINADVALIMNLIILLGVLGFQRCDADVARNCRSDTDGRYGR